MPIKYADTLYETPDNWGGDTYYADEKAIAQTARDLRKLGDEWKTVSVGECSTWSFVKTIGRFGVYRQDGIQNYMAFERDTQYGKGFYQAVSLPGLFRTRAAQYNSIEEAEEELAGAQ